MKFGMWQCADYTRLFRHHIKIVVDMVTEIVKMLHRLETYVLGATPVFVNIVSCFMRLKMKNLNKTSHCFFV